MCPPRREIYFWPSYFLQLKAQKGQPLKSSDVGHFNFCTCFKFCCCIYYIVNILLRVPMYFWFALVSVIQVSTASPKKHQYVKF